MLTYGCESIYISKSKMVELDKAQGKIIKTILGLNKYSHTTPILQSLNCVPISTIIGLNSLNLLRSCMSYSSNATHFYVNMIYKNNKAMEHTLVGRAKTFAAGHNIDLVRYIVNTEYKASVTKELKVGIQSGQDGLIDSMRVLLSNYYVDSARDMLQLLVSSF